MKSENLESVRRTIDIEADEIKPHPKNPRRGKVSAIKDSIKINGYYPTIFVQKSTNFILKGNHTYKALKELFESGFAQYKSFEVNEIDVNDEEALRIVLADNASSDLGAYSNEAVFDILSDLNKTELGLVGTLWQTEDYDNLKFALNKEPTLTADEVQAPTEEEAKERVEATPSAEAVKEDNQIHEDFNVVFPAEATYDIPMLDMALQVTTVKMPFMIWSMQRTSRALPRGEVGTLAFYADDVTFEGVWKSPNKVVEARVSDVVEVNFSTDATYPLAYGLWQIYRKRWLARYWQSKGIKVMADLCVAPKFRETNLLGIPKGWRSYCDRSMGVQSDEQHIENYEVAKAHAGTDDIIFLVYGGGEHTKRLCSSKNWLWLPDEKMVIHGKHREHLEKVTKEGASLKEAPVALTQEAAFE